MREILEGITDIHVHTGPSVADRELDGAEMLKEAIKVGYRGFLIKDHYFPTMMGAKMIEKHLGNSNFHVFGGIALNNSVGGFNLNALDAAYALGAKTVYMPTISSNNHIVKHKGHFLGSGKKLIFPEKPIVYVDNNGEIQKDVIEVLKYIAARPDLVLCTGHGSAREIDALIPKAFELGVKKIIVNHPYFLIGASYEQMRKWAKMGAYIELNAVVFKSIAKTGTLDDDVIGRIFEFVPIEHIIIVSDLGQKNNGSPVEGMYNFIKILMNKFMITENQINLIAKTNPANLMGIN